MHASHTCSRGIEGEAKLDYFGEGARVRANVLYTAALPSKLRFDVYSPFGVTLSTLTTDGRDFALFDLREKVFLRGPATTCNVSRFTRVPVPPHALAQLLRGEAPVLVHTPADAKLSWESGRYVVRIASKHRARQEIELEPSPDTWDLPWSRQRVRVLEVRVEQQGYELYEALLDEHRTAKTAAPRADPDGILPTIPPSGPHCLTEVPMRLRLRVPESDQVLTVVNQEVALNPPLVGEPFVQPVPRGVSLRYSSCAD